MEESFNQAYVQIAELVDDYYTTLSRMDLPEEVVVELLVAFQFHLCELLVDALDE